MAPSLVILVVGVSSERTSGECHAMGVVPPSSPVSPRFVPGLGPRRDQAVGERRTQGKSSSTLGRVFTGLESPSKLVLLLVAAFVLFGAKRLPEIGRSLGHGMRGFKDALDGDDDPPDPAEELLSPGTPAEHDQTS